MEDNRKSADRKTSTGDLESAIRAEAAEAVRAMLAKKGQPGVMVISAEKLGRTDLSVEVLTRAALAKRFEGIGPMGATIIQGVRNAPAGAIPVAILTPDPFAERSSLRIEQWSAEDFEEELLLTSSGVAKATLYTARHEPAPHRDRARSLVTAWVGAKTWADVEKLAAELGDGFVIDAATATIQARADKGQDPFLHAVRE